MKRFHTALSSVIPAVTCLFLLMSVAACGSSRSTQSTETEDETIHLGYDSESKASSSIASETIDPEERGHPASFLSDLLRGSTAGVVVTGANGGITVRIRGGSSVYGSNDPLYVVDGMPVRPMAGGTLPSINPHDVKSITILKDAAATSLYGSRGANGVIVVETK